MTTDSPPEASPSPAPPSPQPAGRAAPVPLLARPWPWVLLLGLAFAVPVVARMASQRGGAGAAGDTAREPPVYWALPAWELTGHDGRPFGAAQLRGKVYVANFIFTQCVTACPLLTQRMAIVQGRLREFGERVHMVSISIDPRNDTPERLRAFAQRWRADPARWTFATGPDDTTVFRLVNDGFRLGLELPERRADGTFDPLAVAHAEKFVLVDAAGRMRGAYDADPEGLDRLVGAARALLTRAR